MGGEARGDPPPYDEVEAKVRERLGDTLSTAIMGELHQDAQIERFDLEGQPAN